MARAKSVAYRRHRRTLKMTQGFFGTRHRLFRRANEALLHSKYYATVGRKKRKDDFRRLWIARINAAAKAAELRGKGGLVGVAVEPNGSHNCGNSRYLAIPWFDACLSARLPEKAGETQLQPMPAEDAWLAPLLGSKAEPAATLILGTLLLLIRP